MTGLPRVCLVTAGGPHPAIIANALGEAFAPIDVVLESPESKFSFLRRRARLNGVISTVGQFATMALIVAMKRVRAARIRSLLAELNAVTRLRPEHRITRVESVNSQAFVDAIQTLRPDVIVLCGCRIVEARVISRMPSPLLNYHAGITPLYRGMNGGYWALAEDDVENFGATVHLVDRGVDTGAIVGQVRLAPVPGDAIWTYAYRQAAASREMCVECVRRAANGTLRPRPPEGPSQQWFHPPIWKYVWTGFRKGVW